jgi:hypothetical protein
MEMYRSTTFDPEEIVMKNCLPSLAALLIAGSSVYAQPQIGSYSPPVTNPFPIISPYLNMNRTGTAPAINYYGIVKPQMESQQAIQQLQQQYQMTQNNGLARNPYASQNSLSGEQEMAATGRPLGGYFNYSHYFPLYYRGGNGGGTGMPGIRR